MDPDTPDDPADPPRSPIQVHGAAPVQGFGRIGGLCWYFRARHEHWSLAIGAEDPSIEEFVDDEGATWAATADWGRSDQASYMPEPIAVRIISEMLDRFASGAPPGEQEAHLWLDDAEPFWERAPRERPER